MIEMMSITDGSLYEDINGFQQPPRTDHPDGLYLELENGIKQEKRNAVLLSTPDTRTFPLSTPEVASLLTTGSGTTTTSTPTPSRAFGLRHSASVTAEQEMYAQGFLDALDQLHHRAQDDSSVGKSAPGPMQHAISNSSVIHTPHTRHTTTHGHDLSSSHFGTITGPNPSLASVAPTYVTATMDFIPNIAPSQAYPHTSSAHAHDNANFSNAYPSVMNVYSNPHTTDAYEAYGVMSGATHSGYPGTGPVNPALLRELQAVVPADLKTQEMMKVDRKKARNRIAASKCRLRRLQRESDLQSKVKLLKEHNQELNNEVNSLKDQIYSLKKALLQHMKTGCQVNLPERFRTELDSSSSE